MFAMMVLVALGLAVSDGAWNVTAPRRRLRSESTATTGRRHGTYSYRDVKRCRLHELGERHNDDKFVMHTYGNLYCEVFRDFRRTRGRKLRMLEIGFGCGHTNHGASAQLWKQYFSERNGPGLELYEVEYGPHPPTEVRVRWFPLDAV